MEIESIKAAFDLDLLDAVDEAQMTVMAGGVPTDWVWTFAGPGHPQGIAQSDRVSKVAFAKRRLQEQAQVNGKKWKAPEQEADEVMIENINFVLERLIGWHRTNGQPVTLKGNDYPFTIENARALLMDRRKGALLQQAVEFILDDNSFTKRSAAN